MTRILTTHVGSLPRPPELIELVFAEDRGEQVDREWYDRLLQEAVSDRVQHQVDAGVDFVSDGEMSKIGYATYIRHRLSGFEVGDVPRATPADLDAYPRYMKRLADEGGSARYLRPICRGRSHTSTGSRWMPILPACRARSKSNRQPVRS